MSAEDLSLVRLSRQWEQFCGAQGLFGTVQRWLLWIMASMLQRVFWSLVRNDYLELRSLRSADIGLQISRLMQSMPTFLRSRWSVLMQ